MICIMKDLNNNKNRLIVQYTYRFYNDILPFSQQYDQNAVTQLNFFLNRLSFFFLIHLFIYFIFIFGCGGSSFLCVGFLQLRRVGATLCCGGRASHWWLLLWSTGSRHVGSVVVACGLQSAGSVFVAHGLSCSAACGIFPDQGSNLCPLHWQADS